jgi:nicotinamidase/pyrazinamidase
VSPIDHEGKIVEARSSDRGCAGSAFALSLTTHLVVIDPQNDFMDIAAGEGEPIGLSLPDGTRFRSTLPVPGALADMDRLAAMVGRLDARLGRVHVTLDSHLVIDVAHPAFWHDTAGNPPPPFTMIPQADVASGAWSPRNSDWRPRMLDYTAELERAGKFVLMVWPEHCLVGSWGHNIVEGLRQALANWERANGVTTEFVAKGLNPLTEHYGALIAEVPDPADPATQLNGAFLAALREADVIAIAGEASSHCVATTVRQIVDHIGERHVPKLHLLTDCMSPVPPSPGSPDFPALAEQFLRDMAARGAVLTTSDRFLI